MLEKLAIYGTTRHIHVKSDCLFDQDTFRGGLMRTRLMQTGISSNHFCICILGDGSVEWGNLCVQGSSSGNFAIDSGSPLGKWSSLAERSPKIPKMKNSTSRVRGCRNLRTKTRFRAYTNFTA